MILLRIINFYIKNLFKFFYSIFQLYRINGINLCSFEFPLTVRLRKGALTVSRGCRLQKNATILAVHRNSKIKLEENVVIDRDVTLVVNGNLLIKSNSTIFDGSKVSVSDISTVSLGNNFVLGSNSTLTVNTAEIYVGHDVVIGDNTLVNIQSNWNLADNTQIGDNCCISPREPNTFGRFICKKLNSVGANTIIDLSDDVILEDNVIIGPNCVLYTHNHDYSHSENGFGRGPVKAGKITIGKNSWVGTNVIILPSVTIGENCVIAAGSVVTRSLECNGVYAGVPAKLIKTIV